MTTTDTARLQSAALARLPKWAQREITRLQSNLDHATKRLEAALAAQGFADTDDYAIVPSGERAVRFHLSDARFPYIEVRRHDDRKGRPMLAVSANEGLVVRPQASNVVLVQAEER